MTGKLDFFKGAVDAVLEMQEEGKISKEFALMRLREIVEEYDQDREARQCEKVGGGQ